MLGFWFGSGHRIAFELGWGLIQAQHRTSCGQVFSGFLNTAI